MFERCGCHRKCSGILLFIFGVLFFLNTLQIWPEFTIVKYWPLILMLVGLHDLVCSCKEDHEGMKKK